MHLHGTLRDRRLAFGAAVAACLFIATVVVAGASVEKPGSGRIFFGHHQYNHHLAGGSKFISTQEQGFAFVAHLKHGSGMTQVRSAFDKLVGHSWVRLWRLSATIPGTADNLLAKNYKLNFLAKHGIRAPGYYRLIIFGRGGRWLAHGAFRLIG